MDIIDRLITRVEMQNGAAVIRDLAQLGNTAGMSAIQIANLNASLKRSQDLLAGGLIAAGLALITESAIKTGLEMEKLQTQLDSIHQGPGEGVQAMGFIRQFAEEHRRDIKEVADAYTELGDKRVLNLRALQDTEQLSERSGKSMKQTAEAVGKALQGDTKSLKEFGIELKRNASEEQVLKAIEERKGGGLGALTKDFADIRNFIHDISALGVAFLEPAIAGMADLARIGSQVITMFQKLGSIILVAVDDAAIAIRRHFGLNVDRQLKQRAEDFAIRTPKMPKDADDFKRTGGVSNLIRQIVGGAEIARLGIKASELPGLSGPRRPHLDITIRVEPNETIGDAVQKVLRQASAHGWQMQPS